MPLVRVMMDEARRAIFDRESMVDDLVKSLVLATPVHEEALRRKGTRGRESESREGQGEPDHRNEATFASLVSKEVGRGWVSCVEQIRWLWDVRQNAAIVRFHGSTSRSVLLAAL